MPFWLFMTLFLGGVATIGVLYWLLWSTWGRRRARRNAQRLFPGVDREQERQNYIDLRVLDGGPGSFPLLSRAYVWRVRRAEVRADHAAQPTEDDDSPR